MGSHPLIKPGSTVQRNGATSAYTFSEWGQQATRLAESLAEAGVGPDDRVAMLAYNGVEQFIVLYATMKLGAIYVPINYRLASDEIKYILNQSESKVLFVCDDELCSKVDAIVDEVAVQKLIRIDTSVDANGWLPFASFLEYEANPIEAYAYLPDQPVYQMYTSGTTGFPKGVLVTQKQLAAHTLHVLLTPPRMNATDPNMTVAPLFHASGLMGALMALCSGRPVIILRDFNPLEFVECLVREKVADVALVPAMLQAILLHVPNMEGYDFSNLKRIVYGGSPITPDLLARSMAVFKCDFQQVYGMTEATSSVTCLSADDHKMALNGRPELLESCGRPGVFVELKVVNHESRVELPLGEIGEIAVKAPHLMKGYSKQQDKTDEVLADGWYYTGDGGYIDDEGYVYLKDRMKDMIISGGENVYPVEVENSIITHPAINDVAVVGCPDERWGEAVVAVCVSDA